MRDRQYRESFLPTPLVSVFATCLPLFVFKCDPDVFRCVLIVAAAAVGNTSDKPLFSVCIAAHYGTYPNMSIAKFGSEGWGFESLQARISRVFQHAKKGSLKF
jgi:hypothetical protein